MTPFFSIAAAMVLAVAALIAVPLLSRKGEGARATWTLLAVLAVLLVGGAALYHRFSNWNWQAASQADSSPQNMVSNLARRLARHPEDFDGWMLLAHSYSVLGETPLSVRAYERANELTQGTNAAALMGLAEELVDQDQSQLSGRAANLIEQALKVSPHDPKALFYGAAAAIGRRDFKLARDRFADLLQQGPPDNVRTIIEQQIAALDQKLAADGQGSPPPHSADQPAEPTPVAAAVRLKITVTAPPTLKIDSNTASLFVFVRDPRRAGPPLAVRRLSVHFPQTIELSTADAMIPGHGMTVGQDLEVVARIARGGGPTQRSGDPFGEIAWHSTPSGAVSVVIDRQTP